MGWEVRGLRVPDSSRDITMSGVEMADDARIEDGQELLSGLVEEMRNAGRRPGDEKALEAGLREVLSRERVRWLAEWEVPKIENVTEQCQVTGSGSIRAVRMDLLSGVSNLKKPVVSGLLVLHALRGRLKKNTERLVDAGNMNTGFALRYFCERFELKGLYVMSRLFDRDMVQQIETDTFSVIQAPPKRKTGMEREFYQHLLSLMKRPSFRRRTVCLWHARYSSVVMRVLGDELASNVQVLPDTIVVGVGSGATLSALMRVRRAQDGHSEIVVPEHRKSPVLSKRVESVKSHTGEKVAVCSDEERSRFRSHSSERVPHFVIGPHYEEINPYIEESLSVIDQVWQYTDREWMAFSALVRENALAVGNSSAANLFVARCLADEGHDVLTVIYEPMRRYYLTENDLTSTG